MQRQSQTDSGTGFERVSANPTDVCTILIWKGEHPRWPLVVAANRDEFEERASTGPQVLVRDPLVVGGRDEVAGGTWFALRQMGLLIALANRRGAGRHDPGKRSRGRLVLDLAASADLDAAADRARSIDAFAYNPFIMLVADPHAGLVVSGGEDGLRVDELRHGRHAITNRDLDSSATPTASRARAIVRRTDISQFGDSEALAGMLEDLLRDHAPGPRGLDGGLCVHRPADGYGTRSSWIALVGADPPVTRLYYIEGHPCEGTRSDATHLLRGIAPENVKT